MTTGLRHIATEPASLGIKYRGMDKKRSPQFRNKIKSVPGTASDSVSEGFYLIKLLVEILIISECWFQMYDKLYYSFKYIDCDEVHFNFTANLFNLFISEICV